MKKKICFMGAIAALFFTFGAPPILAHSYKIGEISIGHVWSAPTDGNGASIYGPLLNNGMQEDRLISVQSPISERARFRIIDKNVETWPDDIALKPGKPFALAPWREHIWLSGLKQSLRERESFPLSLTFARAGTITIDVTVENEAGH